MAKCTLLLILTAAISMVPQTEAGSLRQKRHTLLDFPNRRRSEGFCHNGGTPVSSFFGKHLFCLCADGSDGEHCELDTSTNCYTGTGIFYKGKMSTSESGRRCLHWDRQTRKHLMKLDINSGRHNYCRNLKYKWRPWCFVVKGGKRVPEYCDIPRCGFQTESHFTDSHLTDSHLTDTHLTDSHLTDSHLTDSHLTDSHVTDSHLTDFHLTESHLMEAKCGQRFGKQMKIVGGTVAAVESHPWIAAIFWKGRQTTERAFRCGGSLISPCWVLTAAHCFPDSSYTKAKSFFVTLGKTAINQTDVTKEQTFQVEEVIVHTEFDNSEGNFNNDIALLKLQPIDGQCAEETLSVRTVCLPRANRAPRTGTSCEIAGYGKEKEGLWYHSQYLREAKVVLLAQDVCSDKEYYGKMITENMVCAGKPDWSQDACKGDSGGPMVCEVNNQMVLFGIVSWGEGCSRAFRPGVYTAVANYNDWIEKNTGL